jgi:hypothetical protein
MITLKIRLPDPNVTVEELFLVIKHYFRLSDFQIRHPTEFILIARQECLCSTIGGMSLDQVDISPKDPAVQYFKHLATIWWDLMGACGSSGQDQTTSEARKSVILKLAEKNHSSDVLPIDHQQVGSGQNNIRKQISEHAG